MARLGLVLAISAGLAAPVLSAWGLAVFAPVAPSSRQPEMSWLRNPAPGLSNGNGYEPGRSGPGVDWFMVLSDGMPPTDRAWMCLVFRAGWPFYSFKADAAAIAPPRQSLESAVWPRAWRAGVTLGSGAAIQPSPLSRPLPLAPLWPGLLANTAISLSIALAPLAFLGARRRIRRARGRCERCGHQLLGEQARCPECSAGTGSA